MRAGGGTVKSGNGPPHSPIGITAKSVFNASMAISSRIAGLPPAALAVMATVGSAAASDGGRHAAAFISPWTAAAIGAACTVLVMGVVWAIRQRRQPRGGNDVPNTAAGRTEDRALLATLARIQGRYIERLDETAGLEAVLQDLLGLTGSDYGILTEWNAGQGEGAPEQRAAAWRNDLPGQRTAPPPDMAAPMDKAVARRHPVTGVSSGRNGALSVCAVPLEIGDSVVGVIALAHRSKEWDGSELARFSSVFTAAAQILYALRQRRARDIAVRAIEDAAERQRLILENMADGILILDENLVVRWINRATERLFGYKGSDLVGLNGAVLFDSQERDRADGFGPRQFQAGSARFLSPGAIAEAVLRDGNRLTVEMTVTPITTDGAPAYVATIHDVSRQKHDADALAQSEREVRSILDNMAETFFRSDLEGRLVMVSRSVTLLLGYDQKDLLGTRLSELYVNPDDQTEFLRALNSNSGRVTDARGALRHKDGHTLWVSTNARYWRDAQGQVIGIEGTTRDITERLRAEKALRDNERTFRAIADYTFEWESWIGADGALVWVSPGVERTAGYTVEDCHAMAGYPLPIVHPDDRAAFAGAFTRAHGGGHEFRILHKDGREVWAEMSWQAIADETGRDLGVRTNIRDITEAKRVENHLVQQAKLATLGETAAGLVHELSQPLNIIRLTAEASLMDMEAGPLAPAKQKHQFSLIESQARRMGDIIDHIRVFSRKDHGTTELFAPLDAVVASLDLIEEQFKADGIGIVRDIPDPSCVISGRRVQLEQVVLNLLSNARDSIVERHAEESTAAPDGKITVRLNREPGEPVLRISVEDNGHGFPPGALDQVFEPFFTTKEVGFGTGLGLSVSFGIVASLKGRIQASNTEHGACVDIELPCEDTPEPIEKSAAHKARPILADGTEWHALVVDDEVEAAHAIATFVESLGFRVSVSYDGEEAEEIFAADPADVLITDLRMPKCDGHTLIRRLRETVPSLPVIVTTGHFAAGPDADDARRSNPDAIIRKPVSLEKLRTALATLRTTAP